MAVAYCMLPQEGTKGLGAGLEVRDILPWAVEEVSALYVVYIPRVDN